MLAAIVTVSPTLAQDAVPGVTANAGGASQEAKTEAAAGIEGSERVPGWSPGIALGVGFNLVDSRHVVGQQEGTTVTLGAGIDAAIEYNSKLHEWRNGLLVTAGVARTPAIDEFLKTNDGLDFETIYLLHIYEIFGPFARFRFGTQMFPATDVRGGPVDYAVTNLDGSVDNFTGRRLALTDPFQPISLRESLGVFVQPLRKPIMSMELRAGFGAQETIAEGGFAIDDDPDTDTVEVIELDDSFAIGGEAVVSFWGFFDDAKRVSYTVGAGALFPFVTSELPDGDDRGLGELISFEANVGLNAKLFDWASLTYKLKVVREPLLVNDFQVSNTLLLNIGAAFGSKAPKEPEPECDCEEEEGKETKEARR